MNTHLLYIFTRTPIHVGAGSSVGPVDLPVQRERHTGYPIIPGSSIKGVLRDLYGKNNGDKDTEDLFGGQNSAGKFSISEARVLTFPVRSAKGAFAFVTCPLALTRFSREAGSQNFPQVPEEPEGEMSCYAGDKVKIAKNNSEGVVLEEYRFSVKNSFPKEWENKLLDLMKDDPVWSVGEGRFVLLRNEDFSYFVRNTCEVAQHVAIDPQTGTSKSGALFNIETVPSETMFYATVTLLPRKGADVQNIGEKISAFIEKNPLIQFGGDSTTGLGFCSVKLL